MPALVWWITALHVVLLLAYSLLLPTYQAPDEPQHTDLAHLFAQEQDYPAWDERYLDPGIVRSQELMRSDPRTGQRSQGLTAEEAMPRAHVPAIEELAQPPMPTDLNYMPQHPPAYYSLTGGAGWLMDQAPGDPMGSFTFENWFYRLVSLLLVAPLPLIIWRVARQLKLPQPVAVAATLVPLAVPQLAHNGSAVNNDSLMWLLFWLLTPVAMRMAGGDLRPRTAALAGVLTGLALFTKGLALVLPLWVGAAVLLAVRRGGRASRLDALRAGLVYLATSFVAGGWWWARNLIVYGKLSPSRFFDLYPGPEDGSFRPGAWLREWVVTTRRFWGDFGWYYVTKLPDELVAVVSVVCLLGLVVACRRRDPVAGSRWGDRLMLTAFLPLLILQQGAMSFRSHLSTGRIGGMQGRYWFGAMVAFAVIVVLGLAALLRQRRHLLPFGVLATAAVMHALAVHTLLTYHWGGPEASLGGRLRALADWAPLPPVVLGAVALAGLAAGAVIAGQLVVLVRRGGPDGDSDGDPDSSQPAYGGDPADPTPASRLELRA